MDRGAGFPHWAAVFHLGGLTEHNVLEITVHLERLCYILHMARIAHPLFLLPDQVVHLETLLRRSTLELRVARRCRALLLAAEGLSNTEIGMKLDMQRHPMQRSCGATI